MYLWKVCIYLYILLTLPTEVVLTSSKVLDLTEKQINILHLNHKDILQTLKFFNTHDQISTPKIQKLEFVMKNDLPVSNSHIQVYRKEKQLGNSLRSKIQSLSVISLYHIIFKNALTHANLI